MELDNDDDRKKTSPDCNIPAGAAKIVDVQAEIVDVGVQIMLVEAEIVAVGVKITHVESEIEQLNSEINSISFLLEKPFNDWTDAEKNSHHSEQRLQDKRNDLQTNKNQLVTKENQLRTKENQLRTEKNQLRSHLLIMKENQLQEPKTKQIKPLWKNSTLASPKVEYDKNLTLFELDAGLFELSSNYVANTDIALIGKNLILYCRSLFHLQFDFLQKKVIDNKVLGFILGPPGTGKSTTAIAFASSLDRNQWIITWISLSRGRLTVLTRFYGNSIKSCEIGVQNLSTDVLDLLNEVDDSKQHLVFIDGYVLTDRNDELQQSCNTWLISAENRRLVYVSSMSSRRKSNHMSDVQMNLEEFFVYSWTEEEYMDAVKHEEFLNSVKNLLVADFLWNNTTVSALQAETDTESLVLSKMYFAGGSARWMFFIPTKTVIESIEKSISHVQNVIPYIQGAVGDQSNDVVNRLFSASAKSGNSFSRQSSIISQFAALLLAIKSGPDLIRSLKDVTKYDSNPSMDGWMLEMWFFASIRKGGLVLSTGGGGTHSWPESNIITNHFPDFSNLPAVGGVWLKPNKWNQGGYDAIYINKQLGLVRFAQVTGSDTHSFKIQYFHLFLKALSQSDQSFDIATLEIFFVVHESKVSTFRIIETSGEGLLSDFKGWEKGHEQDMIQIVGIPKWD
jgi:hypothetical protein